MTTNGAVANPYSSAPRSAAITTSRPVLSCPSAWTTTRPRRPLSSRVCRVSAKPNSQGAPACLSDVSGDAPVPPSWPEIRTTSAWALETPAATVPTPTSPPISRAHGPEGSRSSDRGSVARGLDGVDVVVAEAGDQPDAGVECLWQSRIDLVSGQLPAFTRLALRHLDWMSSLLTRYSLVTPKRLMQPA